MPAQRAKMSPILGRSNSMDEYRILKYTNRDGIVYEVQKKHSWFGFWYNFDNSWCEWSTGCFVSEDNARKVIERHRTKSTVEVINVMSQEIVTIDPKGLGGGQ